jgi:hypothetical protein
MRRTPAALAATAVRAWQAVLPSSAGTATAPRLVDAEAEHLGHVELDRLFRYLGAFLLVGLCLMTSTWSRIDMRRTAVDLHIAAAAHESAIAEQARLELELATLIDPLHLSQASLAIGLVPAATITDVPSLDR